MTKPSRKVVALFVAVGAVALISLFIWFAAPKGKPRLSVTYLGAVNGHGHWRLRFGITNIGNSTVFTATRGRIEVLAPAKGFNIGATEPKGKLVPGDGHVVDAVLSDQQMASIDGRWRYTCFYAQDGLRSRIYLWQWGAGGPGSRANWLIPQPLKGMPLTVVSTGDWLEPPKETPH